MDRFFGKALMMSLSTLLIGNIIPLNYVITWDYVTD